MLLGALTHLTPLLALDAVPADDLVVTVVFAVAKTFVSVVLIAVVSIFGLGLLNGCLAFDDFKLVVFCQLVVSHIYAPRGMP